MKNLLTAIILLTTCFSFGQDEIKMPELDTKNKVHVLEFEPDTKHENIISAYMKGTTVKDSLRFWAEGTILIQNVMVTVLSTDRTAKIKVDIVKDHWEDSKINGYLKNGAFQESFDTAGKFGVVVTSDRPGKPFYLAVWTSGELVPNMGKLYYKASEENSTVKRDSDSQGANTAQKNSNNSSNDPNTNYLMLVVIVVLVIIALLLSIMVFRKKKAAMLLAFVFLFGGNEIAHAQAQSLSEVVLNDLLGEYTGVKNLATYARNLQEAGYLGSGRPLDPIADADSEADVNPAGGPRLPSSCIPRRYGGTQEDGTGLMSGSNGGNGINIANSTSEINSAGEESDRDASKGLNDDEKVNQNYQEAVRKANEDYQNALEEANRELQKGLQKALETHSQDMRGARIEYTKRMAQANGDAEKIEVATKDNVTMVTEINATLANTQNRLQTTFANRQAQLGIELQNRLAQLAREKAERSRNGQSNRQSGEPEKDENNLNKKENDDDNESKGLGSQSDSGFGSESEGESSPESGSESIDNNSGSSGTNNDSSSNNEGCTCLDRAYEELDRRRLNLERLRIIYSTSMKKINAGIAFGDNVSGVHGVSGLAWQSQKMKILKESIPTLNRAYDGKYAEMIEALEENLLEIDRCERLLGYENWYNHAGFIYYQFMADKYKRN